MLNDSLMKKGRIECVSLAFLLSFLSAAIVIGHTLMLIVLWKDPLKRFRTAATVFVFGMVSANFLSGIGAGPLIVYHFIEGCAASKNALHLEVISNAGNFLLYWTTSVSYLSMLGLSVCQYIGVKIPHKHTQLVTKKNTITSLAMITFISLSIPSLLLLGVSPSMVEKLQLHIAFQLATVLLCAIYAALGGEYLRQVRRARECSNNVQGATCVRVRDRNFTRANLLLLACVTVLSIPIMISWHLSMYGANLFASTKGEWASGAITIAIFLLKLALDPLIYCLRLTIYRRAFKRTFKLRDPRVTPRHGPDTSRFLS